MVMMVVAVLRVFILVMVMMVAAAFLPVLVLIVVAVAAAFLPIFFILMVMMAVVMLLLQRFQRLLQGVAVFDGVQELLPAQLGPGGGDDDRAGVALPQQGDGGLELVLAEAAGAAQDDGPGVAHLVVVKFAEVFDIHPALGRVADHGGGVHLHALHALHSPEDVAELAHAAGLDEDAVGVVLLHHLLQGLGEVAHQGAADAAGVQLVHPNARLGHEAAVNADFAELVLDQHQLLALIGLGDELFDERGLARPQKAGENVNLRCHICFVLST